MSLCTNAQMWTAPELYNCSTLSLPLFKVYSYSAEFTSHLASDLTTSCSGHIICCLHWRMGIFSFKRWIYRGVQRKWKSNLTLRLAHEQDPSEHGVIICWKYRAASSLVEFALKAKRVASAYRSQQMMQLLPRLIFRSDQIRSLD